MEHAAALLTIFLYFCRKESAALLSYLQWHVETRPASYDPRSRDALSVTRMDKIFALFTHFLIIDQSSFLH